MQSVIVDTGVWFALFDAHDEFYRQGAEKADLFEVLQIVIPWPTMYEALGTRFVKNTLALERFESYLKSRSVVFLDDAAYRASAFDLVLEWSLRKRRPISMVDWIIRLLIDDTNVHVDYLATFNIKDFHDVCVSRGIEII